MVAGLVRSCLAGASVAVVAALWGSVLGRSLDAQDRTPSFRARTEIVRLDVSVFDDGRRPVKGLAAEDFNISVRGRIVPIVSFAAVDLAPSDLERSQPRTGDVATNAHAEPARGEEGRIVVILLHRSILPGAPWAAAKRIANAAIEALGPLDLAAVLTGGGEPQNLTADKERLRQAVLRADPSGVSTSDMQEIEDRVHRIEGRAAFSSLGDGRCMCGACGLEAIQRVADALDDAPARKKQLLFIGRELAIQEDPTDHAVQGCGFHLSRVRAAAFGALDRTHLVVHSFDPTGLEIRPKSPGVLATAALAQLRRQDSLRVLPDRTGGRAVLMTNAPEDAVRDVLRESESYYILGFEPQAQSDDDSDAPIDVTVRRRGLRVRANRIHARPDATRRTDAHGLEAALQGTLAAADFPMALHLAAFAVPGSGRSDVTVTAGISARAVPNATASQPLELLVTAYDAFGVPEAAARQTLEVSWPRNAAAAVGAPDGPSVQILSQLELEPGTYEIRAAVGTSEDAPAASVFTHITVPDYEESPLTASQVVIGAGSDTLSLPEGFLDHVIPITPTTRRVFARQDAVEAFLRIYQGHARVSRPVRVDARITDMDRHAVWTHAAELIAAQFEDDRSADIRLVLPTDRLPPGTYTLRFVAESGAQTVERQIEFSIR